MNIFLPYENNVEKSVASLDDLRLKKQAVECYQLLCNAIKEKKGIATGGHSHHPVYLFYKDNIPFLAYYGYKCSEEYFFRSNKHISIENYFAYYLHEFGCFKTDTQHCEYLVAPRFIPYYMEGYKNNPNCIRTTENVTALFRAKLCKKWDNDKLKGREPKWTNRKCPNWYIKK